ncbi:LysR substrate-binding domain-containing protein [Alginatibacterium sediminis]|nr:LysR substrate-binding domain-containing protein [Alginatibacterium sediminis]
MNTKLPNFNLLRSFESAARHQSYSRAANELCISQAAVSQQMRNLESNLGVQLFQRKGKKMHLTEPGVTLLKAAQKAFGILQESVNAITKQELAGSLTISSTQAFIALWLMPRLSQFSALYPEIQIRVLSSAKYEDLKLEHIDLAVHFGNQVKRNTNPEYACEFFGEDFVYPVCSARLNDSFNFEEPSDLLNSWLVGLDQANSYDWSSWFDHCNVRTYQNHQQWTLVHSTDMALNAVQNGHGVALAAHFLVRDKIDSGELVIPIKTPHPKSIQRHFVFDPQSSKLARLNVFMRWIESEMSV